MDSSFDRNSRLFLKRDQSSRHAGHRSIIMQLRLLFVIALSGCWMVAAQRSSSTTSRITRTSSSTRSSSTSVATTLRSSTTRSTGPSSSEPPDPTVTSPTTSPTHSPTESTPPPTNLPSGGNGLGRNDIIGLSIGIPLGIITLTGLIAGFLIRRRRQRDRRSIDPNAGAGKKVYDPSPELIIRASTPAPAPAPTPHPHPHPHAVELPTVRSDQWTKAQSSGQTDWWRRPLGRTTSTTQVKYTQVSGPNISQSPQELPA